MVEKKKGGKGEEQPFTPPHWLPAQVTAGGITPCSFQRMESSHQALLWEEKPHLLRGLIDPALPQVLCVAETQSFLQCSQCGQLVLQRSPGNLTKTGKTNTESGIYPANPSQTSPLPHLSYADGQSRPAGPHHLFSPQNKTEMELPAKRVGALSLGWSWVRSSGACTV